MVSNKVQLITYADAMGGNLPELKKLLDGPLKGLFGGLHILPPFPSSGDRGFAPIDYYSIDSAFGSWADMTALAENHEVMIDLMVNHVSRKSKMFQDYLQKGNESPYASFFLPASKVLDEKQPLENQLSNIVLRRPCPWSTYTMADGSRTKVWTTFGGTDPSEQIDLDVSSPAVRQYFTQLLSFFASQGIAVVRMDAVGYVIKKAGTSCFLVEPEFSSFLEWAEQAAAKAGITLVHEIHADISQKKKIRAKDYLEYDFLLPFAVLHALITEQNSLLLHVMQERPNNAITMLDCHDGIPVQPDMAGFLTAQDAWNIVDVCQKRGARFTQMHSAEHKDPAFPNVHQICGTYYSLLGCDDDSYIAARALQFFVPGVPQVYYVGFLAGENDESQRQNENDDRGLNRHNFTQDEIKHDLQKEVVQRLMRLIRIRNEHPAFEGTFNLVETKDRHNIVMRWEKEDQFCELRVDLKTKATQIVDHRAGTERTFYI